ncbi:MAG: hypothetical protein ACXVCO_18510, partial [Ktedonobacterales bacterium]
MSCDDRSPAIDFGIGYDVFDISWRGHWSPLSVMLSIQRGNLVVEYDSTSRYNLSCVSAWVGARGDSERVHAMSDEVKQRKAEHVAVSLANDVSVPQSASWADVRLVHRALPEVDIEEIDTSVDFLGRRLHHPIFVSSMTGGHPDVAAINER